VTSNPKSSDHYVLFRCQDGSEILKIDKLVYVLIRKPNGLIVSESFTPSEFAMYQAQQAFN